MAPPRWAELVDNVVPEIAHVRVDAADHYRTPEEDDFLDSIFKLGVELFLVFLFVAQLLVHARHGHTQGRQSCSLPSSRSSSPATTRFAYWTRRQLLNGFASRPAATVTPPDVGVEVLQYDARCTIS